MTTKTSVERKTKKMEIRTGISGIEIKDTGVQHQVHMVAKVELIRTASVPIWLFWDYDCNRCGEPLLNEENVAIEKSGKEAMCMAGIIEGQVLVFHNECFREYKKEEDKEIIKREKRIAKLQVWYAKLDKPCQSMWIDSGEPRCSLQYSCFILNEERCPEGRILKKKRRKNDESTEKSFKKKS